MGAPPGPIPLGDGFVGPAVGFVNVAAGAGIGHAELDAEVRPGDPDAVIHPVMNPHVIAPGHVAFDALGPGPYLVQHPAVGGLDGVALFAFFLVEMMLAGVVVACPMTLQAQPVAFLHALDAVDVVAVAAAHVPRVHLALSERGVGIHLFQDLAVGEIQVPGEQARQHGVQQVGLDVGVIPQDRPPGMARCAQLHGFAGPQLGGAHRKLEVLHRRPGHVRKLRPLHMSRSGAVAGLAADVDVRPGGLVRVGLDVVVFPEVGGMTCRAHPVPVLRRVGPVQPVLRIYRLVRVEMIPAPGVHIPGDGQALHPAAGKGNQVLLEGVPAEGVRDLEIPHPAFGTLGVDKVLAVLAIEPGGDAGMFKGRVVEIAAHTRLGRDLHGVIVVGAFPQFVFGLMAGAAFLAADKHGGTARLRGRHAGMIFHHGQRDGDDDQRGGEDACEFPARHKQLNPNGLNPKFEYRNSKQILNLIFLWVYHLLRLKPAAFDSLARFHLHDVVLNADRKNIERPRRRG